MTALVFRRRASPLSRRPRPAREVGARAALPPLDPRLQMLRSSLLMLAGISVCFAAQLLLISPLQQRAAQQRAYDSLRADLAAGTAPVSAAELEGRVGDPVAYLEIPSIGLGQVILEGTASGTLADGPGHRRDTPLPGHAGTSVVMGRHSTFGGPFSKIGHLDRGDIITVTTGAGVVEYRVRGVRHEGDDAPPPVERGRGRLVLATAEGSPFLPTGVLLVDADLVVPALGSARPAVGPGGLPGPERAMAIDGTGLWRLLLWLEALLAVLIAGVWAWHRLSAAKAWIALSPALALAGLMAAGEATRLLPNLL